MRVGDDEMRNVGAPDLGKVPRNRRGERSQELEIECIPDEDGAA